jgi:hypothetical protein
MQTLVMIHNPADIASWSEDRRLDRWERVMRWHQYARQLNEQGKITHAWGSHGLGDAERPDSRHHTLVTVYSTTDLSEYDDLREIDPLLDVSDYVTVPLVSLEQKHAADVAKFEDLQTRVVRPDDPVNARVFAEHKAVIKSTPPDFAGKYPRVSPANEGTDFDTREGQQAPLRVLLYGVNPDEYVDMWNDMTKLLHCQKLLWWHDYVAMLHSQGHVTHAWGSNDYTASLAPNAKTGGHVAIYRTADFDEFDGLYRVDPVRSKQLYISIALRPIADQRASDERRYALARTRTLAPLP